MTPNQYLNDSVDIFLLTVDIEGFDLHNHHVTQLLDFIWGA